MWGGGGHHGWGHGGLDDEELGQIYNHDVVTRLYPFFKDRLRLFMFAMVMMLVYTATLVATPWLIGFTVDNYIVTGDRAGLNQAGLIFLGLVAANYAGNYAYMRLLGKISQHILYRLRTAMFDHLQVLSVPFFDRNEVGRIIAASLERDVLMRNLASATLHLVRHTSRFMIGLLRILIQTLNIMVRTLVQVLL